MQTSYREHKVKLKLKVKADPLTCTCAAPAGRVKTISFFKVYFGLDVPGGRW